MEGQAKNNRAISRRLLDISDAILIIRGHKVILDSDLESFYGNAILRSQFVTSSWGGRRTLSFAFTEQGVAMLSSVLRSKRARY